MRLRIHGHYRIDANGRIVPVVEKRDSVLPYAISLPRLEFTAGANQSNLSFVELCVLLGIIGILMCAVLIIIPRVQRAVAAAQAAQFAAIRTAFIQEHAQHSPSSMP